MKNPSDMTNLEKNLEIAGYLYPNSSIQGSEIKKNLVLIEGTFLTKPFYFEKDYCNDWNDLMPLIIKHAIQFHPCYAADGKTVAFHGKGYQWFQCTYCVQNKEPQQALVKCLILVLRATN